MHKKHRSAMIVVAITIGFSVLLGVGTGIGILVLYEGIDTIWEYIPRQLGFSGKHPAYILALTTSGGLVVGLCRRYLGDYPKLFKESLHEFKETGQFDYKHLPQGLLIASASLLMGASLGLEVALMALAGGMVTWFSLWLREYVGRCCPELLDRSEKHWPPSLAQILLVLGGVVGGIAFMLLARHVFIGSYLGETDYSWHWQDLVLVVPVSALAAVGGQLFTAIRDFFQTHTMFTQKRPVLSSLLGGVVLGLLAALFPIIRFSGQHEMAHLFQTAYSTGTMTFLLIGLAKIATSSVLLGTGWKGGPFLPLMFGGAAIGLATMNVIPGLSPVAAGAAGMTAITIVLLENPILAAGLGLALAQMFDLTGVIVVAALVSFAVMHLINIIKTRRIPAYL
ncbi:MAG: hypothetical protein GYB65_14525, partial [Chloroflexi bacterium]|nr:hypothetical protein [Chloroflexota bacterium]